MAENLEQKTLEKLEELYDKAVKRGDEILADTICYLISEKQKSLENSLSYQHVHRHTNSTYQR